MNKKIYLETLQPADRLVLPKSGLNLVQHHAIYLGNDNNGNRIYIENALGKGVQVISESYLFRDGNKLTRVERFEGNTWQRNAAIKFAISLIGRQYDLLNFNCEHYANTIQHNKTYSKQVTKGISLGVLVLFLSIGLSK